LSRYPLWQILFLQGDKASILPKKAPPSKEDPSPSSQDQWVSYPAGRSAKKGLFGEDPYKINFAGKPSGLTARIGPGPGGETSGPLIKEIYRSTFPSNGAVLTMLSWWIPLVMKPMSSITAQCSRPSFVVHGLAGGNPAGQTRLTGRLITAPLGFRHPSAAFT